ncbi:MAG: AsmA-like C-terminal domain-containing protein [SAR324 cluster bacterium]|nr:AsmA-like C-terminal domain-containing protein [SAR324 cluster bacterium]
MNVGKIFIFLFVFCFAFIVVPFWLLTYPPELRSIIAKQTGLVIEIESFNRHIEDFSKLYLDAQEVRVYSQQDPSPIAHFKRLSVVWDLQDLLLGRISLDQVKIERLELKTNISEEGKFQIGDWAVPVFDGEHSGFALLTFHLNYLEFDEGMFQIQFPAEWEMPLVRFSSARVNWQPEQKDFQVSTDIEWGGKTGILTGNFHLQQGRWQGNYRIADIPLHVWTIPGVPNAFPSMSVDGRLSGKGKAEWDDFSLKSRMEWNIAEGKLFNPKFPAGEMFVKSIDGKMDFIAEFEKDARLSLHLEQAPAPPGPVDAQAHFHFMPGKPPRMSVFADAQNWNADATIPYIYGFVPDVASDWMKEHLHGGDIHTVHFDLDWEITTNFEDVNDILHLNLRTEVSGVSIDPFETIPRVENLHGYLHLGLWGVGIEVDRGEFPGTEVTSGNFAISYGAPVVTPMKLQIMGKSEAVEAWPAVRSIWSDSIPWLEQLSFHGRANTRFVLEDPNILDEKPLSIKVSVVPQSITLQWKTSNHQYHLKTEEGVFTATLDKLGWENFHFTSGTLEGTMGGEYPFDEQQTPRFLITLENLQNLLPAYGQPDNSMKQWMPQQLFAKAELWQKVRGPWPPDLWQLDVETTDEEGQHLNIQVELGGSDWTIPHFSGNLGQIAANGSVDFRLDKGNIDVQIQSTSTNPADFKLKWGQGMGEASFQMEYFSWQNWLHWEIPLALKMLIPSQTEPSTVKQWDIHFQTPHLVFAPKQEIPVSFTGIFIPEQTYQLSLSKLQIGEESGSLIYKGNLQKGNLLLQWNRFNLLYWANHIQFYAQAHKQQPISVDPVNTELFQELQINLKVTEFFLPEGRPLPLSANFHFYQLPEERKVVVHDLKLGISPLDSADLSLPKIQDVPLFVFPAVPNVFPRMPFYGQLNASGAISFEPEGSVSSRIKWNIMEGVLENPKFPAGRMPVVGVKGDMELALLSANDSYLAVNMLHAGIPFGQIKASADFLLFSEGNSVISIAANAGNWNTSMARPYLYGLMPDMASSWLKEHTTGGRIDQASLDLYLEMAADALGVADILSMELMADIQDMTVMPFEGVPKLTGVGGLLKLGTWGGEVEINAGSFPGGRVKGGKLSLVYGTPTQSPLKLSLMATADGGASWPAIRPLWSDGVPWLDKISFTGDADLSFLLEYQDVIDKQLPAIEVKVFPKNMGVQWRTPNYKFHADNLQGTFIATWNELVFEKIHFISEQIEGRMEGRYPLETEHLSHFYLDLQKLETLLPKYTLNNHPFAKWFPEKLSAKVELKQQKDSSKISNLWELHAIATDEYQQHLKMEAEVTNGGFKIQRIAGKLGRMQTEGMFDFLEQTGFFHVAVSESPQNDMDFQLRWANGSGLVSIDMPQLQWEDWSHWKVPQSVSSWMASSPSSAWSVPIWKLEFNTPELMFSSAFQTSVSFSGTVTLGETYQVMLPNFKVGKTSGNLSYEGNLQKGKLNLYWNELNPLHLIEKQQNGQTSLSQKNVLNEEPSQVGDGNGLFQELEIELDTPQFYASKNFSNPLHANLRVQRTNGPGHIIIENLTFGKQKGAGVLKYRNGLLDIAIRAKRLDVVPWLKVIHGWNAETPSKKKKAFMAETGNSQSLLPLIKFDIETENLYFDDTWTSSVVLRGDLDFQSQPSHNKLRETVLNIDYFNALGQQGMGRLTWGKNDQYLSLSFQKMNSFELITNVLKMSKKAWSDVTIKINDPLKKQTFDFDIKAPAKELNVQGNVQWNGNDYRIVVNQLNWDQQHGEVAIEHRDNRFYISGNFEYLDFGLWKALSEQIQREQKEQTDNAKNTLTIDLPENDWRIDMQAKKIRFLDSTFNDFIFNGRFGPEEIKIPKLVWKKKDKPAFSLAGYLNHLFENTPEEHWDGKLSTDISTLGDMMEMLFGGNAPIVRQFPITRGNTQLQATIQLFPAQNRQWTPHANILFKSNEGIIKRSHVLAFFLATLSIQSYLKVVEGKLSGFEGKGIVYNSMDADINMKGSLFQIEKFIFASPNMRIVTSGKINYENRYEDLLVCFQPFETLDYFLNKIPLLNRVLTSKRGAFLEGCYQSKGTIDNPSIIPLPHTLLLPGRIRDMLILDLLDQQQETNFDEGKQ